MRCRLSHLAVFLLACQRPAAADLPLDERFWAHWGDGRAEVSAYALDAPLEGRLRSGTAVAVVVTEPWSLEAGEKLEAAPKDALQAVKLNLIERLPTGLAEYRLMTSAFVAASPGRGVVVGQPLKIAFSSQDWCGQVFHQLRFGEQVEELQMSYLPGADAKGSLPQRPGGLSEDLLLLWARGLAAPRLSPGESRQVPLLRSVRRARLEQRPVDWVTATVRRDAEAEPQATVLGAIEVDRLSVEAKGWSQSFLVERAWPHRLVAWSGADGTRARLIGQRRLAYWEENEPGDEAWLLELGLAQPSSSPRPSSAPSSTAPSP